MGERRKCKKNGRMKGKMEKKAGKVEKGKKWRRKTEKGKKELISSNIEKKAKNGGKGTERNQKFSPHLKQAPPFSHQKWWVQSNWWLKITPKPFVPFPAPKLLLFGIYYISLLTRADSPWNHRFHKSTYKKMQMSNLKYLFFNKARQISHYSPKFDFFFPSALKGPAPYRSRPRPAAISELITARNG